MPEAQKRIATATDVAAIGVANKKKPKEADFKKVKGFFQREWVDESGKPIHDGTYQWGVDYKPNDGHGNLTREALQVQELMLPSMRADADRQYRVQSRLERVQMRDGSGSIRYVEAGRADEAARCNGWTHVARAGGLMCKAGPGGMLFRLVRDVWEATGKLQVGINGKPCPRKGLQYDPDGYPWRWFRGAWVRIWE